MNYTIFGPKGESKIPLGLVAWYSDHVIYYKDGICTLSRGYYAQTRFWWWYRNSKTKKFGYVDALTQKFERFKNRRLYFTNIIKFSQLGEESRVRLLEALS